MYLSHRMQDSTMSGAWQWRDLITHVVREVWPCLPEGPAWIEAQVDVESRGVPDAVSHAGAIGLLQLMPGTADDLGVKDPQDPEQNLRGGVRYLKEQYEHLNEVPNDLERLYYALAAYNCGRAYINRALHLAQMDGATGWGRWDCGRMWLMSCDCVVAGRRPRYQETWAYVDRIQIAKAALGRVAP